MKNMKKTLALLLALAMCVSMLGTTAFAARVDLAEEQMEIPMGEEVQESAQKSAAPAPAAPAEIEEAPAAAELMEEQTEAQADGIDWDASEIIITTVEGLQEFAAKVNAGNAFAGKTVKLGADIDLTGVEWTPIGQYDQKPFKGTFDGDGKTISNLTVSGTYGVGLFGATKDNAVIKNFTIENVTAQGSLYVGAVVGWAYTGKEISNVTVKGDIKIDAWWYAGVIGGNGYLNTVNNCKVEANEGSYIRGNDGSYIGGIWGFRGEGAQKITNCSVSGLSIIGVDRVGGISGIAQYGNEISGCTASNVTVTATDEEATTVGLIAGACQGTEQSPSIIKDNTFTEGTVTIGDKNVTESVGEHGTNINGIVPVVKDSPVAKISDTGYETLAAALAAVANSSYKTITIVKAGGYAPITVPAGVTVQAAEGVAVTFKGSFEGSVKVGANVTFNNLTFVGANPLNSSVGDNLTVENCTFVGDSSDTGTAMYIHTPNITVKNCTFKNYRRGYYTCGDNHAIGKIVFTGNTFENVKIPVDGYWGKKATDSTQVTITGNTFKNDGKPVYVCLWDYTQYLNSNQADRQGSALANVTVNGNTGDYQLQLIHTDWRWETPEVTTDNTNVVYCSYVEVENADNVTALKAQWAGEGELPDFMDHTTAAKKNGKFYFYEIPVGQYNVTVTYTNGASVTQALKVDPQTLGEDNTDNTQKLTLSGATPKVAKVGEDEYDSLHDAITVANSGENKTVTMLADQTVDTWNQIWNVNGVTIDGQDHTLTVKKIESGVNGNYLLYDATRLEVHDLKVVLPNGGNGFDVSNSELSNVSITGAKWGVAAGSDVTITGCTFKDNTYAIYTNDRGEGENLKVTNNTFTGGRAIILRNNEVFTGNTVEHNDTMLTVDTDKAKVTNNKFSGGGKLSLYADTNMEGNAILCGVKVGSGVTADLSDNYWGESEPTDLPEGITVLSRYTQWDDESKTASVPVVGSGAVAEVDGKYYTSLQAAIDDTTEGQTVKLLKDAELTGQTNLVGINLDLGGKTISYASENVVLGLVAWGTVTIKNGTINVPNYGIYVVSGHTTAENLTVVAQAEESTGIYVNGDATFILDKDSSVSAGWYGIVAYGTTKDNVVKDPTLKIYGKVTADDGYAITGNGNRKTAPGSLINIYDGAEVKSDRYIAIYHPQAGKLNILGGLVEGYAAGIAIKSGTLNVKSGATVSCVGAYAAPTEPNSNGAEASGAAIQIEANSGYAGGIEVNVEDGATVKSTDGNAIYQYYGWKNGETVDQAKPKLTKITITGGAIIGGSDVKAVDVYDAKNADGKIAISGGTFSTDVSDYCVEGYQATRNADGTYGVAQITGGNTSGSGTTGGNENLDEPDVPLTDKPFLFTDVAESDWFYDAVKYAFNNDLMLGTTDTTFEPGMTASRGMIVTMLYRLEKEPTAAAKADFPDVLEDAWYTEAVHWGNEAGVVTGYSDGRYAPDDMITREQLVVILYRYAKLKGCDMSARADLSKYTDVDQVSGYAADAMAWAVEIGLVKGTSDTTLSPAGDATRGQIATIMTRLCEDVLPKEA